MVQALGAIDLGAAFSLSGVISPAQLAVDQNDWAPTGFATASTIRVDIDASGRKITGLAGGAAGRVITLQNIATTFALKLSHESASSAAANRFVFGRDLWLGVGQSVMLWYDNTSSRWRPVSTTFALGVADEAAINAGAIPYWAGISFSHVDPPNNPPYTILRGAGPASSPPASFVDPVQTRSIIIGSKNWTLDAATASAVGAVPDKVDAAQFADAATQGIYVGFFVPRDYTSGGLTLVIHYIAGATDGVAHTIRWEHHVADHVSGTTDASAAATTTAVTGQSRTRTLAIYYQETAMVLLASTAVGRFVKLELRRLGADAADTYVGALHVAALEIKYQSTIVP